MSARAVSALGALLLFALLAPAVGAGAEDVAGPIGATVEIRQSALTASLYEATSDVRLTIAATVHIATERGHFVNLEFSVVGTSWAADLSPATFRTQTAADVPVTAAIDVPRTAAEGVYTLALRAVDRDDLFPIDTQAAFTISVFHGPLALFATTDSPAPRPGDTAAWTLTLRNLGTREIYFDEVFDAPGGFELTVVNPPVQVVDAGRAQNVTVRLKAALSTAAGDYAWSVRVTSSTDPDVSPSITVPFEVAPAATVLPPGRPDFLALYWIPITVGMVALGIIAYISLTEVGYLAVAFSVFVPLFTRIRHEKVLDNFTRGQIYGYIQANPGAHYSAVQQVLDIENGVLAYHLRVLMREEFIVARNEGVFKRFYPRDYKIPKGRTLLTRLQLDILEAVEEAPGISQREVARALGESKQVISYNVSVLREAGLLAAERRGREVLLRPGEAPHAKRDPFEGAAPQGGPSDLTPL